MRLRIDLSANDFLPQNLAFIRKGVTGQARQKPDKKHPRHGDVSNEKPVEGKYKKTKMEQKMERVDKQYMEQDLEQAERIDEQYMEQDLEQLEERALEQEEEQDLE